MKNRCRAFLMFALLGCMLALGQGPAQAHDTRYPFGRSPGGQELVAHIREIPNLGMS